jgi:very-short-patch-repair endonuclease
MEHAFYAALLAAGLDQQYAYQVRPKWWQAAVDFWHISSKTAVQLDGIGHFTKEWADGKQQVLQRDIRCAAAALEHGARMVRISNLDMPAAVDICVAAVELSPIHAFVLLSPSFKRAGWKSDGSVWHSYLMQLMAALNDIQGVEVQWLQVGDHKCFCAARAVT